MSKSLNKIEIERYSRQIILKNIGVVGQKKILNSQKNVKITKKSRGPGDVLVEEI